MRRSKEELEKFANDIRRMALDMAQASGRAGCHIGGSFSALEILAVMYDSVLDIQAIANASPDRDRFIASKAHCILSHFSALVLQGLVPQDQILSFHENAGLLAGHPQKINMGLEFSGGSLGMGLSLGIGMAIAGKKDGRTYNTYVLLGDGEINEGSVWEGFMSAPHFGLDNLTAIIDFNKMQFDGPSDSIMNLEPLDKKLESFGWLTKRVNGHSVEELQEALMCEHKGMPLAIVADTVKARGIPSLENKAESHHASLPQEDYDFVMNAIKEGKYGRF